MFPIISKTCKSILVKRDFGIKKSILDKIYVDDLSAKNIKIAKSPSEHPLNVNIF